MSRDSIGWSRGARWLVAALMVLGVVIAGALVIKRRTNSKANPVATVEASGEVERMLALTGRVRVFARPQLGLSVAGSVREVLVREGDRVARGQLLVQLEDAQAQAALAQARAALVAAQVRAASTADQAELAYTQASRDLDRARALHARGVISTRDFELAERAATVAKSELDVARARVPAGTTTALAEVSRARAAVDEASATLALMRLTAPASGTVLVRHVERGSAVVPGQALLDIALDGPTELVGYAREEDLAALRVGALARASADAFPDSSFAARVNWIAPVVDPAQGTVEVRFAVPKPPLYLRPDMTVSINIELTDHRRVAPERDESP